MKRTLISAAVCVGVLSGCVSDQSQGQTAGTLLGAVAGGLLGAQFGSGKGKLVAAAIGTLAGAYFGNQIGKVLDTREQAEVEKETVKTLASSADGHTTTWTSPDSGASARVTPVSTERKTREVSVVRKKEVEAPTDLILVGETYQTVTDANLRAAPSTSANVVGGLKSGDRFQAIGSVADGTWILVGQKNRSIGYVHAKLVSPAPPANVAAAPGSPTAKDGAVDLDAMPVTDQSAGLREAVDLDKAAFDTAALSAEGYVADKVQATQECRVVAMEVEKQGARAEKSFEACRTGDGAWEIL